MSRLASIDLRIVDVNSRIISSPVEILNELEKHGWGFQHEERIFYLPLNDNDMFDWQEEIIKKESFFNLIKKKEEQNELIGVAIFWKDTNIGGELLLRNRNEMEADKSIYDNVSFCINANRKIIDEKHNTLQITDVSWYLERILPIFNQNNFFVEHYSYDDQM